MATEIIPAGTTAINSSPFTLAEGEQLTLSIFPASGNSLHPSMRPLVVAKQASNSAWIRTRVLLSFDAQIQVVRGAGTFRLERDEQPAGISIGADRS